MTTTGFGRRYAATFDDLQDARKLAGGLAAADYHGGGDADRYVVGGDTDPNHLYENRGDGTFVEVARRPWRSTSCISAVARRSATSTAISSSSSGLWRAPATTCW